MRGVIAAVCLLMLIPASLLGVPAGSYTSFKIDSASADPAKIAGWILPAGGKARGTLFICHGYGNSKEYMVGWQWIRDEGWNVVMFDFREHGESTQTSHLSSLGYHEIWDLKAVIDHAEAVGLEGPYCIYGRSMGAAVGLRWAADDDRIVGVLAASPFRNAYDASRQVASMKTRVDWPMSPFVLDRGFVRMLKEVDIPTAVARRDDLKIWIIVGEYDCFGADDQHAILDASASPATYKHLLVAPGKGHSDTFLWKGNGRLPSHDDYIRQFLQDCEGKAFTSTMAWIPGYGTGIRPYAMNPWVLLGILLLAYTIYRKIRHRRMRRASKENAPLSHRS